MQTELVLNSPPIAGLPVFHAWDFIYAQHPEPGERPVWYTEKKYPLRSDLVEQGAYLYGVRFGKQTTYAMLDIDCGSVFHPTKDPFAVRQICEALEPLGLVRSLICQSSSSGGLHIYFPWAGEGQVPYEIGLIISVLLQSKGFKSAPGHLEIFPNPKAYRGRETPALYNAHRLPLQRGFYLLDEDFQHTWTTKAKFIARWAAAAAANSIEAQSKTQLLQQYKRRQYAVSASAEKFLNDLNAAIEPGWERTEEHAPFMWEGQTIIPKTNQLLGRIAIRAYVFGHIDGRHPPLEGDDLVNRIVEVAINLPGYRDHCRHQHEIRKRATEWARSVEKSHYFHYGTKKKAKAAKVEVTWHEQKAIAARDKITKTIATLLEQGTLPAAATSRAKVLVEMCKTSLTTLYKNKDLWHPTHLLAEVEQTSQETAKEKTGCMRLGGAQHPRQKNLLERESCNRTQPLSGKGITNQLEASAATAPCNTDISTDTSTALSEDAEIAQAKCAAESVAETIQRVKQLLRSQHAERQAAETAQAIDVEAQLQEEHNQQQKTQLRQWLATGDPILVEEARARLKSLEP